MSRSLDPDTSASLSSPASTQTIYNELIQALTPPSTTTSLLEIEMLGKSHAQALPPGTHVLIDGSSIAVPKATLVKAFMVARKRLFETLAAARHDENVFITRSKEIRDAAAVVLLMDPEHITAANARKRVVRAAREMKLKEMLREERRWLDGMLTSRLHRHTKSPTLWGHRRWVLEMWGSLGLEFDIQEDVRGVVLVAAERHFCNYYAWMHLRWLVKGKGNGKRLEEGMGWDEVLRSLDTVKMWCLRHPTDTAGFSFMLFCLYEPAEENSDSNCRRTSLLDVRSSVCKEVLDRALSFKWTNEAVWVFLRTLVAYGVAEEQREAFFDGIEVLRGARENPKSLANTRKAHDWALKYERATRG
jgi:hypothetical protein